ncbi:MAG: hypothetical protein HOC91_16245 [Nitrospinaceae bacterium]|jgi:hypothetical protein|nr:hypothetical protein [Nitrospinaceae bacterium]MBT3435557.1 hypothetical protein [Nitrospinaceae bacterium]MBT4093069.1 hypothetical protein [Nitrospinaceae bacterium]MBT4432061.1 hypothetical protein [Nitrospinaceae bacterium]MBT5368769.1 hypothetical protein [Nitrospinaceae bacterium]
MPDIFDPTVKPKRRIDALAARPGSLEGKVVGLLDISKPKGDIFLDAVGILLKENYGVRETVYYKKPTHAKPAPEELAEEIARHCDAVVEGLAY